MEIVKIRSVPTEKQAILWNPKGPVIAILEEFGLERYKIIEGGFLIIPTLEGDHTANPGDWIIKGIKGEFYPCKPDVFEKSYEVLT